MSAIFEKIYALRVKAKMTQESLAERIDVSRQTVSKWELGTAKPELEKIAALSELFHVSTDFLIKDSEPAVQEMNLDRLVLRFLGYTQDINTISGELVTIMRDGIIDQSEMLRMNEIVTQLNSVAQMIEELRQYLKAHELQAQAKAGTGS